MTDERPTELAEVLARTRPNLIRRIELLQSAAAALVDGRLGPDERETAEQEAHKLAGSLGVFGYKEGSRLARAAEQLLTGTAPLGPDDGRALTGLADGMAALLDAPE